MSRINELKTQYKESALSRLDVYKLMVPNQANKYAELFARIYKSRLSASAEGKDRLIHDITSEIPDLNEEYLKTLSHAEVIEMIKVISDIGWDDVKNVLKFCSLNERNLIDNKDITSYTTLNQLQEAVNLAELKLLDKEAQKSVYKVFEDDTWVVVRPLTIEASAAYGAGTKWCTTMVGKDYFNRYCRRGALLYNINKQTGYKVACFKNYDPDYEAEFSFWNVTDTRIDSLDSELPGYIMDVIRKEAKREIKNSELEGFKFSETGIGIVIDAVVPGENPVQEQIIPDLNGLFVDNGQVERFRITANGGMGIGVPPVYQGEHALEQALNGEQPDEQYRVNPPETLIDAERRLHQTIEEHIERVVEERAQQQSVLADIELGTLSEEYKYRMQMLAGITPTVDPNNIVGEVIVTSTPPTLLEEKLDQMFPTDNLVVEKKRKSGKNIVVDLFKRLLRL